MAQLPKSLIACGAAMAALLGAAYATPDFSGVWQPLNPPLALRTIDGKAPPLLPDAAKVYAPRRAMAAKGDFSFDPTSTRCAPPGEPRIMTESMPFDIVQTPRELLFGYQWNRLVRFVRFNTAMDVLSPYYFGTSVGKFEGNTLVVDAEGFNGKFFLDRSGMPSSDQMTLTEYFTLSDHGNQMQARIHIVDPGTFSRPWDTILRFKKLPNARITEDICTMRENLVPKELRFFDPN